MITLDRPAAPSRRNLLKSLPALTFGGVSFVRAGQPMAKPLELHFPTEPRARLAVTSWPFRALIKSPTNRHYQPGKSGIDLKEFPSLVAERFNVHNINPLADHFSSIDLAYLDAFRKAVAKAGSHVVDLGLGAGDFYDSDAAKRKASVESGCKWIDIATILGSPSVRQHLAGASGAKPDVKLASQSLGELAEYGAKRNIIVNLENDIAVAEDPFFIVSVIRKVNSPYLRALPDFGNSLGSYDQAKNFQALTLMFEYAANMCHVKDSIRSETGQVLDVDLRRTFALAKRSFYKGYFSMEVESEPEDPFVATKRLVQETLRYLS
jgi:sugar phosphate isomerase/epimerase